MGRIVDENYEPVYCDALEDECRRTCTCDMQSTVECCQQRTNADYIRAMTDEELAEFIALQRFCIINPIADRLMFDTTTAFIRCKENMTMWLKQGVKE